MRGVGIGPSLGRMRPAVPAPPLQVLIAGASVAILETMMAVRALAGQADPPSPGPAAADKSPACPCAGPLIVPSASATALGRWEDEGGAVSRESVRRESTDRAGG